VLEKYETSSLRTDSGLPIILLSIPECLTVTSIGNGCSVELALRSTISSPDIVFLLPAGFAELRYNAFLSRYSANKMLLRESGMTVNVFRLDNPTRRHDEVLLSAGHVSRIVSGTNSKD